MTDLYGPVFRAVLFPAWEYGVRRRPTLAYRAELQRTEWLSPDELLRLQDRRVARIVEHVVEAVPFYSRIFRERGLQAKDVSTVAELARLPLLERETARESLLERRSTRPPLPSIRKMTSGSSGRPLEFEYDLDSEHWRNAVKLRGYAWAGYRPGDPSLHFWGNLAALHAVPRARRVKAELDHWLKRETFVDSSSRSEQALERVLRELEHRRPKVLVCYSQAGAALARHVLATRRSIRWPISVICAAERLYPADRAALVSAFGPDVFETYGSREVMLIAAECDAHAGLHVSMENLVVELVVREGASVRPAEPGEVGEVVLTDLHNYGAPFLRYVCGDLATRKARGRCPCGRGLDRLGHVEGRVADTLRDGAGQPVSGLLFNVLFSVLADRVHEFQVLQRRDGSVDLSLVAGRGFDENVLEAARRAASKFLPGVEFRTRVVQRIPVDASGKRRVVRVES